MGRRAGGDPLRGRPGLLDRPRLVRARAHQDGVAHRRTPQRWTCRGGERRDRRRRLGAAHGREPGPGPDRRRRLARHDARDRHLRRHLGAVGPPVGRPGRRPHHRRSRDRRRGQDAERDPRRRRPRRRGGLAHHLRRRRLTRDHHDSEPGHHRVTGAEYRHSGTSLTLLSGCAADRSTGLAPGPLHLVTRPRDAPRRTRTV
ncbi:hypothetical protein PLANTIT3_30388 [Plantibacter sp. T3]|nr:hypothetical protein PLANTIT3_30388 [Plantibacter sp. T3]